MHANKIGTGSVIHGIIYGEHSLYNGQRQHSVTTLHLSVLLRWFYGLFALRLRAIEPKIRNKKAMKFMHFIYIEVTAFVFIEADSNWCEEIRPSRLWLIVWHSLSYRGPTNAHSGAGYSTSSMHMHDSHIYSTHLSLILQRTRFECGWYGHALKAHIKEKQQFK